MPFDSVRADKDPGHEPHIGVEQVGSSITGAQIDACSCDANEISLADRSLEVEDHRRIAACGMLTSRISGGCCALHGAREKEVSNRGGNGVKEVWDRHREIAQSRGATAACILGGPRLWNGRREQYT